MPQSVPEAPLTKTEKGPLPEGEGWFVLNARDASWIRSEERGQDTDFEGRQEWAELGFRIHVLMPGQRNGMYHGERGQEDFLVVSGECVLVIEGEERRLKAWDFVHCPPWTKHVFVGAGDGPCVDRHDRQPRGRLRGRLRRRRRRGEARRERARGDVEPGRGLRPLRAGGALRVPRRLVAVTTPQLAARVDVGRPRTFASVRCAVLVPTSTERAGSTP